MGCSDGSIDGIIEFVGEADVVGLKDGVNDIDGYELLVGAPDGMDDGWNEDGI